jgi:hypothetical protein
MAIRTSPGTVHAVPRWESCAALLERAQPPVNFSRARAAVKLRQRMLLVFTITVLSGMAVLCFLSRTIVVEKRGGALTFETEMGKGITLRVRLPLNGSPVREEAMAR